MRRVLLAEDDFYLRDLYTKAFTASGTYTVISAADGEQAYETFCGADFDIVLLDVMMPGISGIDILKKIRAMPAPKGTVPVWIITNAGEDEIIKDVFALGADGFLIKVEHTPKEILHEIDVFFENREKEGK